MAGDAKACDQHESDDHDGRRHQQATSPAPAAVLGDLRGVLQLSHHGIDFRLVIGKNPVLARIVVRSPTRPVKDGWVTG
ncbi:hypothetical protein acdb102_12510 [Acidothermaceae bacterium B102]|nr:hypothetical protein acdb102_12510 [Acidothermaceae bacterium B102]